jgi:electron transfer flavoprotein beta subunit
MKILVCVSNVPDTTSKITFSDNNTVFNSAGVQYIVNPYDEVALSKAIGLVEANGGSVTVINVGDASTEASIRKALATGADDAVRVNAEPKDAWYVANQIANYAKSQNFDLILTGKESIDYNGSQVASYLGELLGLPTVSVAKKIEVSGNSATVDREIEGGKEVLTVSLPFVAGVGEGVAEVRIPNMRGIMSARTKPLAIVEPVEVATLSKVVSYETPAPRSTVTLVDAGNVEELVSLLHNKARVI